jgi:putative RNase toxin 16 of polymorphic toxin system
MKSNKLTHPLLAILSVVFMAGGILLPSEAPAEKKKPPKVEEKKPEKKLPAPGRCTQERHTALQNIVESFCRITRCESQTDTLDQMKKKEFQFAACAIARADINTECFEGGDDGHKTAYRSAKGAAKNCYDLIKLKEGHEKIRREKEEKRKQEEEKRRREEEEKRKQEKKPFEWKDLVKIPRIIL